VNVTPFFFYGTLIAGSNRGPASIVHERLRALGSATSPGRLAGIPDPRGWYPAMLPSSERLGASLVHGVVYQALANFTVKDLARLDAYEGYDPDSEKSSLYRRNLVTVRLDGGGRMQAQTYIYNRRLPKGALPIDSGNFASWLADGKLNALGD